MGGNKRRLLQLPTEMTEIVSAKALRFAERRYSLERFVTILGRGA